MNICHRDLKPANLLLDEELNNIYIIDFGISIHFTEYSATQTKKLLNIAGSRKYLSPEMSKAFKEKNTEDVLLNPYKSDIFSLGLIMLELGNLQVPKKIEKNIVEALENFNENYSKTLYKKEEIEDFKFFVDVLKRCLKIEPDQRPDFISLFKEMLFLKKTKDYEKMKLHILIEDLNIDEIKSFDNAEVKESTTQTQEPYSNNEVPMIVLQHNRNISSPKTQFQQHNSINQIHIKQINPTDGLIQNEKEPYNSPQKSENLNIQQNNKKDSCSKTNPEKVYQEEIDEQLAIALFKNEISDYQITETIRDNKALMQKIRNDIDKYKK